MGREVRRVPANWEHPRDNKGNYLPLFELDNEDEDDGSTALMPAWGEQERTHFQMYETTTEGTPISPVMESPEALARWLVDNKADAGAGQHASYEAWLRVCRGGYAPTAMIVQGQLLSGVQGAYIPDRKEGR